MLKRRRISLEQARTILSGYAKIPIRLLDVDIRKAVTVAAELNLYAYDAYLLVCARSEGTSLISLDRSLLAAASRFGVPVVEV